MIRRVVSLLLVLLLSLVVFAPQGLAQYQYDGRDGGAAAGAAVAIVAIVCGGIVIVLSLAFLVLWILMLVDAVNREESQFPNPSGSTRTIWLIILIVSFIFGLYWLAAILYYFIVKRPHPLPK